MKMIGWFKIILPCLGLLLLAGCRGLSTKDERAARHDLATVTEKYRPNGAHPTLPELNPQAGLSNYLVFAMLNQPKVEAAYSDWAASVERPVRADRTLPSS